MFFIKFLLLDLAYVTSLGDFEDASSLFETVRFLAKELEIENAIDQNIFERLVLFTRNTPPYTCHETPCSW